jgi:hypothetical protein
MSTALNQEAVNDTAKLIMHRLIARSLAHDATLMDSAQQSLNRMSILFFGHSFIAEWKELLCLPVGQLRTLLTTRDQKMKRLRLSSPFVTADGVDFSDEMLRRRIRRAAKRIVSRGATGTKQQTAA